MKTKLLVAAILCAAAFSADAAPKSAKPAQAQTQSKQDNALKLLGWADKLLMKKNVQEAAKLYRLGAKRYYDAPFFPMRLGEIYFYSTKTPNHMALAYEWFQKTRYSIGAGSDAYGVLYSDEYIRLLYLTGKSAIEGKDDFINGINFKTHAALFGHAAAYAELPDDLRRMYAEHLRPIDLSGKTPLHDYSLTAMRQLGSSLFHDNGVKKSSWNALMDDKQPYGNSIVSLDYRSKADVPAMYLSIAYEHGIGVPKNRIAAQALRLYARETWQKHGDKRREGHFWLLNDLSAAEQTEAENLVQRLIALRERGDGLVIESSAVLDEVRKFTGQ